MRNELTLGLATVMVLWGCGPAMEYSEPGTNGGSVALDIVLRNGGPTAVFVTGGLEPWATVWMSGEVLRIDNTCGLCLCDAPNCPVCNAPLPSAHAIGTDAARTVAWDGSHYVQVGACMERRLLEAGTRVEVEVCYGDRTRRIFESEQVENVRCERAQKVLGEDQSADFAVSLPGPAMEPTELILHNASAAPLYVQTALDCDVGAFWVELADEQGLELDRAGQCVCPCAEGPGCMIGCPAACAIDTTQEVPPGGSVTSTWSGVAFYGHSEWSGEQVWSCQEARNPLPGTYSARFCWGSGETNPSHIDSRITGERCEDLTFTLPTSTVRLDAR